MYLTSNREPQLPILQAETNSLASAGLASQTARGERQHEFTYLQHIQNGSQFPQQTIFAFGILRDVLP